MPDDYILSMILKASVSDSILPIGCRIGRKVHTHIMKSYNVVGNVLSTVLVDSFVKSGNISYATSVFDFMIQNDVICSTSMISGYMKQGFVKHAENVFAKTVLKDAVGFNAMIEGYRKLVETTNKAIEILGDNGL
jgi:pentatricopeptide repeat protein